ncbi:MAG: CHRD domain-containing protein [Hyphomicrobiaceae bacterium]|nr:CHRD domain-containing protein [Hyphomicrobiaceae bacterium]
MRGVYWYGLGALMTMVWLTGDPVRAESVIFKADLSASNELPPNKSKGTGSVTATYDTNSKVLSWKGTHSGLTGPATSAHFHGPAERGRYAGPEIWISIKSKPLPRSFEGHATLTDAQAADMMAGLWYVNIHTTAYPGGEVRGQLEMVK